MGLQLPGELVTLLNDLGYNWPEADEEKLFQLGQHWIDFGSTISGVVSDGEAAVSRVIADNHGAAITAFHDRWADKNSPAGVLHDGVTAAHVIGGCLFVCAAVVLALKINVIVQLTILAIEIVQAIATAPETFGASLLEVPAFKKITDMAINFIINEAMEKILG